MAIAVPVARIRVVYGVWVLVAAAVGVQIVYPLMPDSWRTEVTVASVVVFFVASMADAARVHGLPGAAVLVVVAGGGGLIAEAVGVATGRPFGHYAYTGTLGPEVLGVRPWLQVIWWNLLHNALRHGGPASQVRLTWVREEDSFRFAVVDQGPGVDPAQEAGLFVAFVRLGTQRTAGLGLSIVQRLATLQGGDCRYRREPATGTCFSPVLRLP